MCFAKPRHDPAEHRRKGERLGFVASFDSFGVHRGERLGGRDAARERELLDVDLLALHGDRHEDAERRHRTSPQRKLEPTERLVHGEVERRDRADEDGARHVAGG